ncbi:hypothetical protein B0H16DRAFT_1686861 [Mycena metata]|uniref:Protein kinase domain-containing protein n=1 Tax=Mycena metata TaxID=1033252 RepID=A0AAD7JQD7_9AGAR|nr:hypothetical protein B0H16DRAFT_1686861 [Mycena metata]
MNIQDYISDGPGFNLFDPPALESRRAKLLALRALALDDPLTAGHQLELSLSVPPQNPDTRSRAVPRLPETVYETITTVLQLEHGIQTGVDLSSQVWTARLVKAPQTLVVLKIIQPSMLYLPDPEEPWMRRYASPKDVACGEAWAYDAMRAQQGVTIPYFFGVQTTVTPSQEPAWVLVLEYIPGLTFTELVKSGSIDDLKDFCRLGLDTMKAIVLAGMILPDLSASNFILTGKPSQRSVIVLDFSHMHPFAPDRDLGQAVLDEQCNFFGMFEDCGCGIGRKRLFQSTCGHRSQE